VHRRTWSACTRLDAVIATAAINAADCSAWCREHGIFPAELDSWRVSATAALGYPEANVLPIKWQANAFRSWSGGCNRCALLSNAKVVIAAGYQPHTERDRAADEAGVRYLAVDTGDFQFTDRGFDPAEGFFGVGVDNGGPFLH
jgi:hypothetical protein